ncbi:MAG: SDR family oxidoreductase [Anaerosomatales bacterium]|nr:SDR family oxidoreductase [Anaerosomatales bacterium]
MRFEGAVTAITGASSGVGLAAAELAATRGAHVALIARDRGRLEAAEEAVRSARPDADQRVAAYSCDVSDPGQVAETFSAIEADLGPVDILLNCAGYCMPGRFIEQSAEELVGQIETNLCGTLYPTRAVVPGMVERGKGHVANVSSMGGFVGVYGYSGYSPAKFGVMGLSEVLRCELKPHGIGVTVLCPPNIDTPGYARELELEPPETAAINGSVKTASPRFMARVLLDAVERGRYLVVPGFVNGALYRLKGVLPELFFAVFDRDVAAVRKRGDAHGRAS